MLVARGVSRRRLLLGAAAIAVGSRVRGRRSPRLASAEAEAFAAASAALCGVAVRDEDAARHLAALPLGRGERALLYAAVRRARWGRLPGGRSRLAARMLVERWYTGLAARGERRDRVVPGGLGWTVLGYPAGGSGCGGRFGDWAEPPVWAGQIVVDGAPSPPSTEPG